MSSKKLRHNEKKALRKNQFLEFGEGNRGASREMRRNPEKYGLAPQKGGNNG